MTTVDTIVEAIEGHRTLNFGYHGFDRVVSPYAIGMTTTNELKMLAYQTEGGSNSGVCPKLRYFAVSDILGLEVGTAFMCPRMRPRPRSTLPSRSSTPRFDQLSDR